MSATRVVCGLDGVTPVHETKSEHGDFVTRFKENFQMRIISETPEELVADLVGIDAPIANALRRILLAEVPSVAFEQVYIFKNTSIIQDEVLSHRIGLIPLNIDPRLMEYPPKAGEDPTDLNTVVFRLSATGKPYSGPLDAELIESDADLESGYTKVYSSELVWEPQGTQEELFAVPAAPVHGDILLAKLAPNQTIDIEAHAVKGIGKDHAKFSPVATATYRLLPQITLSQEQPFLDAEGEALVQRCPMNVFDIEDIGSHKRAYVARPRDCTVCRECIRDVEWNKRIKIERISDHFIFSIESTGAISARELFQEALNVLITKCETVLAAADDSNAMHVMDAAEAAKVSIAAMRTDTEEV